MLHRQELLNGTRNWEEEISHRCLIIIAIFATQTSIRKARVILVWQIYLYLSSKKLNIIKRPGKLYAISMTMSFFYRAVYRSLCYYYWWRLLGDARPLGAGRMFRIWGVVVNDHRKFVELFIFIRNVHSR